MHTRLLAAAAAILFTALTPGLASAHDDWGGGHSHMRELREACDWGNRRACVRLGREIEQRREERRQWEYAPRFYQPRDPWREQRWDPYRRAW
ncbi:hypothetical protein [Azospirillum sp. sgz301742]